MQPDDVVATSGLSNVSAMGSLPDVVLWRGQVPLLCGGTDTLQILEADEWEKEKKLTVKTDQPGVQTVQDDEEGFGGR